MRFATFGGSGGNMQLLAMVDCVVVMCKHMYIMCITVAYDYYTMYVYVDDVI